MKYNPLSLTVILFPFLHFPVKNVLPFHMEINISQVAACATPLGHIEYFGKKLCISVYLCPSSWLVLFFSTRIVVLHFQLGLQDLVSEGAKLRMFNNIIILILTLVSLI